MPKLPRRRAIQDLLICLLLLWTAGGPTWAERSTLLELDRSILQTAKLRFIPHTGLPDSFDNALALNVKSDQLPRLRQKIAEEIGRPLKFFSGWHSMGEAHATTISPPEYRDVLRPYVSMTEINDIARDLSIQDAELRILGLGSGSRLINWQREETFFLIVESAKLLQIRQTVQALFIQRGGRASDFRPGRFFPHITLGYTHSDIHESHGLLKDLKHSRDGRFKVLLRENRE